MDSYPHQRNQTFTFPQYHYPGFEASPPMAFEPWPYGGNYGYPMPCHSCCNHNNVPGYYGFRPSYPHAPTPSPVHFFGGYPGPYHEAYHPVRYVPPPHYSMELPKYEYDKNMPPSYHCCGCPNHSHHQNVDKGVKIEEHEPDVVEKKANDSLVPFQMKNYPYPFVWAPQEHTDDRGQRKASEQEAIEPKKVPRELRPPESLKFQEGDQRYGWFPFDMNNLGSMMQGGDRKQVQDQQSEDKRREFPFPIFWVPSYDNQQEVGKKEKDVNASQDQQGEDQKKQFRFPFIWLPYENKQNEVGKEDNREVKHAGNGDVTKETRINEEKPAAQGVVERKEKTSNLKTIPVKQMDAHKEDNCEARRETSIPVKHVEDNAANKASGTSVRRRSSSPKTSSGLPPVCLRVDPLPRKKDGNGSIQSPSPPSPKGLKRETSTDTTEASASLGLQESTRHEPRLENCISGNSKEVEPSKKEKVIEVIDGKISESKDVMPTSQIPVSSKEEVAGKPTIGEAGTDGAPSEVNKDQGARNLEHTEADNVTETAKPVGDEGKHERKTLTDVEAAVLIQSVYRGFEVRRWEPLKKLKQIAEVSDQVGDVRNRITSLETSDLPIVDKQRMVIGETIMRLLLKLDTIQGLLPSLRDIRRSLAKELVALQEKLDDLLTKRSQDPTEEVSTVKPVEHISGSINNNDYMLEQQKEEVTGLGEGLLDRVSESSQHNTEPCQGQVPHTINYVPDSKVEEPDISDHKEMPTAPEDGHQELPVASGLKPEALNSRPTIEPKDDVVNGQLDTRELSAVDKEMVSGATELEQCDEVISLVEDKTDCSVAGNSSEVVNTNPETRDVEELPQGAIDDESAISEPEKDEPVEMSNNEMKQGGEVDMSPDLTLPIDVEELEMHEPAELPLGIIDEDRAHSEFKKNEVDLYMEKDVSQSGEERQVVALDEISQGDGTPNVDQFEQQPEGTMEDQPIVQSEEPVEVGSKKDGDLPGDSVLEAEVERQHQEEVSKDDFLPVLSEPIESSLPIQTEIHDDVVREDGPSDIIDGDGTHFSVLADTERATKNKAPMENSVQVCECLPAATTEEGIKMQESKVECQDTSTGHENVAETTKEDALVETQSTPMHVEVSNRKSESLPATPTASEVSSIDGSVMVVENDRKLIEENEKLREMMQKLMEAGKDQLQVISNLTGRVKDLEKRLARKKKMRTRWHRTAASGSSCVKPSNNSLKESGVGVAM